MQSFQYTTWTWFLALKNWPTLGVLIWLTSAHFDLILHQKISWITFSRLTISFIVLWCVICEGSDWRGWPLDDKMDACDDGWFFMKRRLMNLWEEPQAGKGGDVDKPTVYLFLLSFLCLIQKTINKVGMKTDRIPVSEFWDNFGNL